MEFLTILNTLIAIINLVILAVIAVLMRQKQPPDYASLFAQPKETQGMTEEEREEFLDADREQVQAFRDAISGLNAFMTGRDEEKNDVERQELDF